jgi:hypothetical protein
MAKRQTGINILIIITKNPLREFARDQRWPTFRNFIVVKMTSFHSEYGQVSLVSQRPIPYWQTSIILPDALTLKHSHTAAVGKGRPLACTRPLVTRHHAKVEKVSCVKELRIVVVNS